ncbi:hypothetical protein OK348_14875 [Flavobacterium sp. MXW15]|uniref:Uncharacterized protein n=1 Tax=Xanthomonas chitinilytica TaxID=2989819 RepID=A0ABT3JYV6_9XANT|nr:hypothetical protein [Xanthomonas sp. H13-6]MCW4456070.1 hypothetical protein [Flavobacterium sp. MXW15]MCW4473667.1 hypothetical protein [Xanthomonas sp. H13-6]
MEKIIFGVLDEQAFEIVERSGHYFVRHDAGAHQVAWREDEISTADLTLMESGQEGVSMVLAALQQRLAESGVDPYRSNWLPKLAEPQQFIQAATTSRHGLIQASGPAEDLRSPQ